MPPAVSQAPRRSGEKNEEFIESVEIGTNCKALEKKDFGRRKEKPPPGKTWRAPSRGAASGTSPPPFPAGEIVDVIQVVAGRISAEFLVFLPLIYILAFSSPFRFSLLPGSELLMDRDLIHKMMQPDSFQDSVARVEF